MLITLLIAVSLISITANAQEVTNLSINNEETNPVDPLQIEEGKKESIKVTKRVEVQKADPAGAKIIDLNSPGAEGTTDETIAEIEVKDPLKVDQGEMEGGENSQTSPKDYLNESSEDDPNSPSAVQLADPSGCVAYARENYTSFHLATELQRLAAIRESALKNMNKALAAGEYDVAAGYRSDYWKASATFVCYQDAMRINNGNCLLSDTTCINDYVVKKANELANMTATVEDEKISWPPGHNPPNLCGGDICP